MSKQVINLGTAPTGVGGDTPRSAFTKAQANFDELYVALGGSGSPVALPPALPVANGGTGGTTQAAARSGLGLKSASIVDTVGLVASGDIIESGSSASGEWVKLINGDMVCRYTYSFSLAVNIAFGSMFYADGPTLAFPQAFIAAPKLSIQATVAGGGILLGRNGSPTATTSGSWILMSPVSRGVTSFTVEYIASGRWKV